MGILDDVVVNAKTAATVVGKRRGKSDLSKLRFHAADINGEIKEVSSWGGSCTKQRRTG